MKNEAVIENCIGCVKAKGKVCAVITEPAYFFAKYNHCFAKSQDITFWEKTKLAIEKYSNLGKRNVS